MHLIWNTENCEISLQGKMTTHDQPSLDEKLVCNGIMGGTINGATTDNKDFKSVANSEKDIIVEPKDSSSENAIGLKTEESAETVENGDNVPDITLQKKLTENSSDENLSIELKLTSNQHCDNEINTNATVSIFNITNNKNEDTTKIIGNSEKNDMCIDALKEKIIIKDNVMNTAEGSPCPENKAESISVEVPKDINQDLKYKDDAENVGVDNEIHPTENSESVKLKEFSEVECIVQKDYSNLEAGKPIKTLENNLSSKDDSNEEAISTTSELDCSTLKSDPNHNVQSDVRDAPTENPSDVTLCEVDLQNVMECDEVSQNDVKDVNEEKMLQATVDSDLPLELGRSEVRDTPDAMECDAVKDDVQKREVVKVDSNIALEVDNKVIDIQNSMECDTETEIDLKETEEKVKESLTEVKTEIHSCESKVDSEKNVFDDITEIESVPIPSIEKQEVTEITANKINTDIAENENRDISMEEAIESKDEVKEGLDSKTETLNKNKTVKLPIQEQDSKEVVEVKILRPSICKLSNTLDILSDDDEEPPKEQESIEKSVKSPVEKQCINLDDDDDIMLIDDYTVSKTETVQAVKENATANGQVTNESMNDSAVVLNSVKETQPIIKEPVVIDDEQVTESAYPETNKPVTASEPEPVKQTEEHKTEYVEKQKPIIPDNFFKTYKKNLSEMTRDDLEEFCVLKIVESIIDRSSLNEIRSKIKTMSQTIDEYKRKTMMLTKQNRDLQVVLKSIQEEQKKAGDTAITPLKITRSVGMQVLMTDKIRRRPIPGPQSATTSTLQSNPPTNSRPARNTNQSPKPLRPPNNSQQIPVPRLVPASNNIVMKTNNATQPNTISSPIKVAAAPLQNGVKMPPGSKAAEKRPYNRTQSVTVDLTDDEPPSKVTTKSAPPPVRLVSPQNLLAQTQQRFPQAINSPRKVYIPISGTQNQNAKTGTVMLKSVPPPNGPRPRTPVNQMVRLPQSSIASLGSARMVRVQGARHPAPLPDQMKQYQPPNWKALPPAPDLKLSKVENGIVISWKIEGFQEDSYEEIASYQLYAYQETSAPPNTTLWKKIGDVKALPLPMACTLTQFMAGYKYYFAVRAVDIRSRVGPFSLPGSILLINKM